MRIEHVALYVNDLENTKKFFMKYFRAKSNEQIVRETGNVLESFSSNTKEITSANERTQDINARLEELASINVKGSGLA